MNEKIAEETGLHVGNGNMNIYNGVYSYTLACHHTTDKEFVDSYVIPLYTKIYGLPIHPRIWSKGAYGFCIHSRNLVMFKQLLDLPLGKKTNISVPKIILSNRSFMKAFIRGFFATDGSVNTFKANGRTTYPRIEMCNVSKQLMNEPCEFLISEGFRTSM